MLLFGTRENVTPKSETNNVTPSVVMDRPLQKAVVVSCPGVETKTVTPPVVSDPPLPTTAGRHKATIFSHGFNMRL